MIEVHFEGIKRTVNKSNLLKSIFPELVEKSMDNTGHFIKDTAMDILNSNLLDTHHMHGWPVIHIKDAWNIQGNWNGSDYELLIENNSDHAAAVEFGTPTPIRPKNAEYLWLGDGIFKEWVRGQEGKHYFQGAINRTDEIKSHLVRDMRGYLEYVLGSY